MKRFEAISRLHRLLTRPHARPLSLQRICEELECSESTAKRCIRDLRYRFDHPIVYHAEKGGYYYDHGDETAEAWELPGLWFTESELRALVTMRELLTQIHPGIFERELVPMSKRIDAVLESTGIEASEVARRIRVLAIGRRPVDDYVFRCVADAILSRRRLWFVYEPCSREGRRERRLVSPQRLVRYRDNWYLDAWCHMRDAVRIFSLDRIREARIAPEAAIEIDDADLDPLLASGFGIFAGQADKVAVLRFTPWRARWVSRESWHPRQAGRYLPDGSWELVLPYSRDEELLMDVLKYGPDVEVIEPPDLRAKVAELLAQASRRYSGQPSEGGRETA